MAACLLGSITSIWRMCFGLIWFAHVRELNVDRRGACALVRLEGVFAGLLDADE